MVARKIAQSSEQTILLFEQFIRKDDVATFIKEYRKILGIPEGGLVVTREDQEVFDTDVPPVCYFPERVFSKDEELRDGIADILTEECNEILESKGIESHIIMVLFRLYIIFGDNWKPDYKFFGTADDLVTLMDMPYELSRFDPNNFKSLKIMYSYFESISKGYSLGMFIQPHASQNQVKDFISKNWQFVKKHRKGTSLLGKLKKHPRQEIYDLVYENRNLETDQIIKRVGDKYNESLSYADINGIIRTETKRREN